MKTENNIKFELHAIVVRDLKASLIINEAFLEKYEIIVDIPNNNCYYIILPDEKTIPFADLPGNPKMLHYLELKLIVIFPGETITIPTPKNFRDDMEVAIESRIESVISYEPMIVENSGELKITESGQRIVQLRSVYVIYHLR